MAPSFRWAAFPTLGLIPLGVGVLLTINPGHTGPAFPTYGIVVWFGISFVWLYLCYRVCIRPRLVISASGVRIRNPFHEFDLTWTEIAKVRLDYPLWIDTKEGQSIRVRALAMAMSESGTLVGRDRQEEVIQAIRSIRPELTRLMGPSQW
jgi:Bacterial PH domain